MYDLTDIISKIRHVVNTHYIGNGAYARFLWQNKECSRKMGINEYGCADAMNILYTLCDFPTGEHRELCLRALLSLQDEGTGLFKEHTHHVIHTTAHCVAAIELFDATPLYPQRELLPCFTKQGLTELIESLNWESNPWPQSHQGAGIYVIGQLTGCADREWKEFYFNTLYDMTDDEYGMSRKSCLGKKPLYHHLNGWFHYTFNTEYAKKPMRYPDKLIDTCIEMYKNPAKNENMHPKFGKMIGFAEIDWVYVLNRATRQSPHRHAEAKDCLRAFAKKYIEYLESIDFDTDDGANDIHMLFGAVCALAELQAALPGEIYTDKPLRLVLDRRPFI